MLKSPPPKSVYTRTCLIMNSRPFLKVPGAIANGLTDIKNVSVTCLFIFNCSWIH